MNDMRRLTTAPILYALAAAAMAPPMHRVCDPNDPPKDPPAGGGGDPPKYLTVEEFDKRVNGAMDNRFKRFETTFAKSLDEKLGGFTKAIEEKLGGAKPVDPPAGGNAGGDSSKPVDPEIAKLRGQLAETEKRQKALDQQLAAEKAEREKIAAQKRAREDSDALTGSLRKKGFSEHAIPALDALFRVAEGRLVRDESDPETVLFKRKSKSGEEELVTIDQALDDFAKTDEGKAYMPARQVAGSGNAGGRGVTQPVRNGAGAQTTEQLNAELMAALGGGQ